MRTTRNRLDYLPGIAEDIARILVGFRIEIVPDIFPKTLRRRRLGLTGMRRARANSTPTASELVESIGALLAIAFALDLAVQAALYFSGR